MLQTMGNLGINKINFAADTFYVMKEKHESCRNIVGSIIPAIVTILTAILHGGY